MAIPYVAPQTPLQWWDRIKNDKALFHNWLLKQMHGEDTAVDRITELRDKYLTEGMDAWHLLTKITQDELLHFCWIRAIAKSYGVDVNAANGTGRYWEEVQPDADSINTFEYACAVAAHAETMRLARIKVISEDNEFGALNPMVQKTFSRIWEDEITHAEIFTALAGPEALEQAKANHYAGMEKLGLVI